MKRCERYQVVALGGSGKIGEEFVKPIIAAYHERVFVLLDSDRSSADESMSADIARLQRWLRENQVHHYVLKRRELENYVGSDAIAQAAEMHPSLLRAVPGHEEWHDIKEAFRKHKRFRYDERRFTVKAFELLEEPAQHGLFGDETDGLVARLKEILNR